MNTSLAMPNVRDEKPHTEVSADPICSRNCISGDDDWVIVKKQRITILIPPQSPITANPQSSMATISSKQSCITRSKRDCNAARKKHLEKLAAKKCQDSPLVHGSIVHEDVPIMTGDNKLPHSSAVPVAKTEWTKDHAVGELFHQETGKATSFSGGMGKPRMPVISSPVANKIIRAQLLERQVAGFGGLRNWLFGCGLGWFVNILDTEKLGMYQLASLTMQQLKDMGLVAVGPRRKLIHAIDSLCHPHHVEMFS